MKKDEENKRIISDLKEEVNDLKQQVNDPEEEPYSEPINPANFLNSDTDEDN